jgi:hypothetical protein
LGSISSKSRQADIESYQGKEKGDLCNKEVEANWVFVKSNPIFGPKKDLNKERPYDQRITLLLYFYPLFFKKKL